jgi:hypothetical protein
METGRGFIKELSFISEGSPDYRMVLYDENGLDALIRWGDITYIDGTHNVIKGRILTLLVVRVNQQEEGFVCAWFVHTNKTISSYNFFLTTLISASIGRWTPSYFVLDFEIALR